MSSASWYEGLLRLDICVMAVTDARRAGGGARDFDGASTMSGWTQRLVGLGEVQVALGDVATGILVTAHGFSASS